MRVVRFLLIPLVLTAIVPLLLACAIPLIVWWLLRTAWFRFSNRGKRFLVYTRRHGWNEFIKNNLVPVCEQHIETVELAPADARRGHGESLISGRQPSGEANRYWPKCRCLAFAAFL